MVESPRQEVKTECGCREEKGEIQTPTTLLPSPPTAATHAHLNTADNSRNPPPQKLNNNSCAAAKPLSCWAVWSREAGDVQLDCQIHWSLQESSIDPPVLYYTARHLSTEGHTAFFCSAKTQNTNCTVDSRNTHCVKCTLNGYR